jgi:hypothetical protein
MTFRHLRPASPRASSLSTGWGLRAGLVTVGLWAAVLAFLPWEARGAERSRIERAGDLVAFVGCGDCRRPGYVPGKPDAVSKDEER